MVSEIVGLDRSPKVTALMTGCWSRDIWTSVLYEKGQGELMGSIHCTRIPFILVAINQSHLLPLSKSYSANPLLDPKTHFGTGTVELFLCHDSHDPLCLPTYALCLAFSLSRSCLIAPSLRDSDVFCLLSAPLWFRCLHTSYCYLFLANWSVRSLALNLLVYN